MGRTAIAWGSAAAHNLAAYSQSELGFATHFNMYPEVQLPSPNGCLGHTRGQVNCAMARSKALINAVMPVYFVWNRKSHISNENLYTPYEAVRGPGMVPGPRTAPYGGIQGPVSLTIGDQNAIKSCRWNSDFFSLRNLYYATSRA